MIKTNNLEVGYLQSERNKKFITVKKTEKILSEAKGKNATKKQQKLVEHKRDYDSTNNYKGTFLLFNHWKVDEILKDGRKEPKGAVCNGKDKMRNFGNIIPYVNKLIKELHIYSTNFYDPPVKNIWLETLHDSCGLPDHKKEKIIIFNLNQPEQEKNSKNTYNKSLCAELQFLLRMKHLLRSNEEINKSIMYFLQSIYMYFTFKN